MKHMVLIGMFGMETYLFCWKTLCWDMLSYTGHPFAIA